jgi:hypothetical protein
MVPVPPFPAFRRLTCHDRVVIEQHTGGFPPYSDFTFAGLWAWDTAQNCAISLVNGNLVVRSKDYSSDRQLISVIGTIKVEASVRELFSHQRQQGLPPRIELVPEVVITAAPGLRDAFCVTEDPDNFDYVYAVSDWARFPLPRFRAHVKRVDVGRQGSTLEVRRLDLGDKATRCEILQLFDRWAIGREGHQEQNPWHERAALQRMLPLAECGGLAGLGAYDGQLLVGFMLWEEMPGGAWIVGHFQKADRQYPGLSSRLANELGQLLLAHGIRFINGEQDLGIPGLRAFKRSLQPRFQLKKYVISERK